MTGHERDLDTRLETVARALSLANHTPDCRAYIVSHPDKWYRWDDGLCICGLTAAREALASLRAEYEATQGVFGNMALADAADQLYRMTAERNTLRATIERVEALRDEWRARGWEERQHLAVDLTRALQGGTE